MSKQSTYQKLKAENAELKRQIRQLVMKPDPLGSTTIKHTVELESMIEGVMLFGNAVSEIGRTYKGFINHIPYVPPKDRKRTSD